MPRRTGYASRGATSSLRLGDPDVGTSLWETEYDIEYVEQRRRAALEEQKEHAASTRRSLTTPRSLKKGYVQADDYQRLDARYGEALAAYRDLSAHLASMEQRMSSVRGSEAAFVDAVQQQHELIDGVRQQVAGLSDSLGRLLGGAERNRSLIAAMETLNTAPLPPAPAETKTMRDADISRRLTGLEKQIGDMVAAVDVLSRTQAALATLAMRDEGRTANTAGSRKREKFEKLPNPVYAQTTQKFWKP